VFDDQGEFMLRSCDIVYGKRRWGISAIVVLGLFASASSAFAIQIAHGDVNAIDDIGTFENGAVQIEDRTIGMTATSRSSTAADMSTPLSPCITTFSGISIFSAMGTFNALANANSPAVASASVQGCNYNVTSDVGWLYGNFQSQSSTVTYTVNQNSDPAPRTGHLHISGAGVSFSFTVTQYGSGDTHYRDFSGQSNYYGSLPVIVWRPSNGTWYINGGNYYIAPVITQQWGLPNDTPVLGDFDGDGLADLTVWRPSTGVWYVLPSANITQPVQATWGVNGDIPVPGDYDGDGKTDLAVFRPSNQTWGVLQSSTNTGIWFQLGSPGDIPVSGNDYDGDGKADLAVFRPTSGMWYIRGSRDGTVYAIQFGLNGDIPVSNRLDTLNKSKLAVWRPSTGMWYFRDLLGQQSQQQFGLSGDVPLLISGNPVVWRTSTATWYGGGNTCCSAWSIQWGWSTDVLPEAPHTATQ